MQQHIHGTDTQHRSIRVIASEHSGLVIIQLLSVHHHVLLVLSNIVSCFNEEAGTAHCGVTDDIILFERRLHQFNHHPDNVSRSTELSVLTFLCHFAENVLIDIAHGVSVVHIKPIYLLDKRL